MSVPIAKLFARIGLQADTKQGESFLNQLKNMKIGLGVASISAAAFVLTLKNITNEAFNSALSLKKFNLETGASTDELQKWMSVADEVSGSGQAVAESIKAITSNQEKIKLGQGNISGYQLLGINPNNDPFKILEQLRQKTSGLNQAMKKNVMEQMGVSKDLIGVLELTNDQFDAMAKRAFIVPEEALRDIDKARASTMELKNALDYFKSMLTAKLAPSIIKINKLIVEWIRNNKDGLIKDIKKVFDWITKFVGAIVNAVIMIDKIIKGTIGWGNAMLILVGVIAILNAALIFSPLGAFIAGIVLLVAVLDDLWVYSQGGDSMIGMLLAKNEGMKEFVKNMADLARALRDVINGDWSNFDNLMAKWKAWGKIIDGIAFSLSAISATLTDLLNNKLFSDEGEIGKFVKRQKEKNLINKTRGDINDSAQDETIERLKKQQEEKKKLLQQPNGLNNTSKNINIQNNNQVKVDIHGDATKKDMSDGAKDGLDKANKNLDLQLNQKY
jgi:hypothetical protein